MSRNKLINKHTVETATTALIKKGFNFLKVIELNPNTIKVRDEQYGEYVIDIKALSNKSTIPLHPERKFQIKLEEAKKKYIGKIIKDLTIVDVIYGPDHGYKNRSFYLKYIGECGHECIATHAALTKHKDSFKCRACAITDHGERKRINKQLPKRSNTYIHWQRIRETLPIELKDYKEFRRILGEKPAKKAEVVFINGKAQWKSLTITDNYEINLISSAIRQAFRYSNIYKNAMNAAKVETDEGTRYRCAACGKLARRSHVQVDHIESIAPLSGEPLKREELIDRIWTENVQVLDRTCHSRKTAEETAIRKANKDKKRT